MRYIIAAWKQATVDSCKAFFGARDNIQFRVGSVPEAGEDCDAVILNFVLAHERYGGSPRVGRAQVLINSRGDGAPPIILACPPMSIESASLLQNDTEIESAYIDMFTSCITAFVEAFGDSPEIRILIHIEGSGVDESNLKPFLCAMSRWLTM